MKMKIINKIFLAMLIFACGCVNNPTQVTEIINIKNEIVPNNIDENYYKSKGFQVFTEFNFAVKSPAVLRDVSRQSSSSFEFNYAGFLNENSETELVFYQITVIKIPVEQKNIPEDEVQKMFRDFFNETVSGKPVPWGEEKFPAYVNDYVHNGFTGRGISVLVNGKVYGFNVITNNDLNSKFNSFINSVVFFDSQHSTVKISDELPTLEAESFNNRLTVPNVVTYTNRQRRFSIDYPQGWEKQENQVQNIQFISFLAPEDVTNFRTNFNVIVSNRTESVDVLFQMTQRQNSSRLVGYILNEKEYVSINGTRGIKQIASYRLNGHAVKGIQYILKKADNTVYTITFTVGERFYQRDKNLIESIIQSFKPL